MDCTVINNETGEIITEQFQVESTEDLIRKKKRAEKAELDENFKRLQDEVLGNFVFFIYLNMNALTEILTDVDLVKFMYIATYVKKEGALIKDNNITYITKKDLFNILKISRARFSKFYAKLIDNYLLQEVDGKLYINLKLFYRGNLKEYRQITNIKMTDFIRIYIKTTRDLYEQTETRKHKQLAIVYKLIPYINYKFNILTSNINERDIEHIEPLKINEVMDILGYDKTNITRFKNDFYSLEYEYNPIFMTLQKTALYKDSIILVNPKVYYRGEDISDLEYLMVLFKIKR